MSDTAPSSSTKKKRDSTLPVELESFTKDDLNCILIRKEILEGGYSNVQKGQQHDIVWPLAFPCTESMPGSQGQLTPFQSRRDFAAMKEASS